MMTVREQCFQSSFLAMSFLLCFELIVLVSTTFQRRAGLYFWSMTTAITGSLMWTLGQLLNKVVLPPHNPWLGATVGTIGYILFIPARLSANLLIVEGRHTNSGQNLPCYTLDYILLAQQGGYFWVLE
jgi:hypothetical protein